MNCLQQNSSKARAIIIGAGKIGAFFDKPGHPAILTHAHAFTTNSYFELAGFVDSDKTKAIRAAKNWGGGSFNTIAEAFYNNRIDIAVVATPTHSHFEILMDLVQRELRFVLCEKPLADSLEQACQIIRTYEDRRIPLGVNYSRRFIPEFQELHRRIKAGEFGDFKSGIGRYGKGIVHNGSHLVDLLRYLIGEIVETKTLSKLHDFNADDPSCAALLRLKPGGMLFLDYIDHRLYSIFELDLFFEKGRIRILDSGFMLEEYAVGSSAHFDGYVSLQPPQQRRSSFSEALRHVTLALQRFLQNSSEFPCTGFDALRTLTVCMAIREEKP